MKAWSKPADQAPADCKNASFAELPYRHEHQQQDPALPSRAVWVTTASPLPRASLALQHAMHGGGDRLANWAPTPKAAPCSGPFHPRDFVGHGTRPTWPTNGAGWCAASMKVSCREYTPARPESELCIWWSLGANSKPH